MSYIDGFVIAVPNDKREVYKSHAALAAGVFKENGALRVVEAWGDDVPEGKLTSFPMAVKREANETVVFSWIEWPDKATRNKGMDKAMSDPRLSSETSPMPFDGKRMIYGGFATLLDV